MDVEAKSVILDESALLDSEDENGNLSLRPGAESLLRKLRHSMIRTGISYRSSSSSRQINLLERTALLYSVDCFALNTTSADDAKHEVMLAWGDIAGSILYLASNNCRDILHEIIKCGWLVIILNTEGGGMSCENSGFVYIDKLEELPLAICRLNTKTIGNNILRVGYVMKPSREDDFAKRGAFPLYPTDSGLMFIPLTFELPLSSQLQEVDVILHKATDEIVSIDLTHSSEYLNRITYSRGMQDLNRYIEHHPDFCVIDPIDDIYPVLDRLDTQKVLLGLERLKTDGRYIIRGPRFLKVDKFNEPDVAERLSTAKLRLPCIVKPQVACGLPDAHNMAIVFNAEDLKELSVPLPAIIQEYVDHSSTLFKFYVLGDKVFHAVKKSIPSINILMKLSPGDKPKPLVFDSLKSLPIANETEHSESGNNRIDIELVTNAANWLTRTLGLTIFGFDVVIQEGTGDHVIVDVNYLPSFKEIPNEIAIPAFWDAIKHKYELKKTTQPQLSSVAITL